MPQVATQPVQSNLVTSDERQQLDTFQDKVDEFCTGSFAGREALEEQREEARQQLVDGVGGDNWVLNIMLNSGANVSVSDAAMEEVQDPAFIIRQCLPLFLMLVTVVVYSCCCWSACCCCWPGHICYKPCRCPGLCAKKRTTHKVTKILGLLAVFFVVILTVVSAVLAMNGFGKIQEGFDNFACTSAELTDDMLNGDEVTMFIGVVPLLDKYAELTGELDDGSDLVMQVDSIVDSTQIIDISLVLAAATLQLMSDTLSLDENLNPKRADGSTTLYHTCTMCEQLPGILEPVIQALDEGAGASLAAARAEVRDQLSIENRADLRMNLENTAQPLADVKDILFSTLVTFFEDGSPLVTLREQLSVEAGLGMTIGVFIVVLCSLVGCCISGCFAGKEEGQDGRPNPCIHRTSICVWCCMLPCSAILFFVGGLLTLISSPLCGFCLIMDDLDSSLLEDISPAVGISMGAGNESDMTMGIIDQCFAVQNQLEAANLMDILFVTENGERKYVRQILVDDVTSQITNVFDDASASLGGAGGDNSLAGNEDVLNLVRLLQDNPVQAMITPSVQQGQDLSSQYPRLAASSALRAGLVTSASCGDHTPDSSFDDTALIPGLAGFMADVHSSCSCVGPAPSCPNVQTMVTCPAAATPSSECNDAIRFLAVKEELINIATYRCDVFEHPTNPNQECDVLNMEGVGGSYNNDCMRDGNRPIPKSKNCNLAEFNDYVRRFGERINKVLTRVDDTVPLVSVRINTDLQDLTTRFVTEPMNEIVERATCGFLTAAYRNMVGSLCYQGVRGMRMVGVGYTMAAILGLILSAFMYAYWRRSVDNWNEWVQLKKAGQ